MPPMLTLMRKIFFKVVGMNPYLDRAVRYRNPYQYWKERGGEGYFLEQEAVLDRTQRSQFIAEEIQKLTFQSLLEVGCGYGKQLQNFISPNRFIAGCDFSRPQLLKGLDYCPQLKSRVCEADGEFLPFKDKSFDIVMSSAVILHNKHAKAQRMIAGMIRVSKRYLAHNEDTDITFSRYGYDLTETYRQMGFKIITSKEIPCTQVPSDTQFTIAEIPSGFSGIRAEDIPLSYRHK